MRNAHFSYTADGSTKSMDIYVESMQQPFALSVNTAQTRLSQQVFPRAYSPGNLTMNAVTTTQDEYQTFARFVREHQVTMINTPGSMAFTSLDKDSPGYQRLMTLYIDAEGILYKGWVPTFTMTKKGAMVPAPKFTIEFYVVFDAHASNIFASRQVQKLWWQQSSPKPIQISGTTIAQHKNPAIGEVIPNLSILNADGIGD